MRITTLAVLMLVACSGSGVTGAAPGRAILNGRFDMKTGTDCSVAGSAVGIGTFGDAPVPVLNGSRGSLGTNHVSCTIHDNGNKTFAVSGMISSDDRLLFAITGTFPATTDKNGFQADSVSLSNGEPSDKLAVFTESDKACTVLYTSDKQGATRGRVWAEVTCATATADPKVGGVASGMCTTITEFRLEDCAD